MAASRRARVLNLWNQPLELHLGADVIVLPPHGSVEADEAQLASPQLAALLARHLVHVVAAGPSAPAAAGAAPAEAREPPPLTGEGEKRRGGDGPRARTNPTAAGKRAGKGEK